MYLALAAVATEMGENQCSFSEMKPLGGFRDLLNANRFVQHRCAEETAAQCRKANGGVSAEPRLENHDQDGKVDLRQKLIGSGGLSKTLRFWVQEFDLDLCEGIGGGGENVGSEVGASTQDGGRPPQIFAVLRGRILYDRGHQDDGTTWDEELVGVYPDIESAERSAQTCCLVENERERVREREDVQSDVTTVETPNEEEREGMEEEQEENRERCVDSPCSVVTHQWEKERREGSMEFDEFDAFEDGDVDNGDGQWLAWVHQLSVLDERTAEHDETVVTARKITPETGSDNGCCV